MDGLVGALLRSLFGGGSTRPRRRNVQIPYIGASQHPIRSSPGYDDFIVIENQYKRDKEHKRQAAEAGERVVYLEQERDELRKAHKENRLRPFTALIAQHGNQKGHVDLLPFGKVREYLGLRPETFPKSLVVQKGAHKYIPWDYAIDQKANDLGFENANAFKEAIEQYQRDGEKLDGLDDKIRALKGRARGGKK